MSDNKVSILFTGLCGMLFTDEKGVKYNLHTERCGNTLILSRDKITLADSDKTLDCKEKEQIISKVMKLTSGINWRIE